MATLCDCLLEVMRPPPTPAPRTHYFAKHEVTLAFLILSVKAITFYYKILIPACSSGGHQEGRVQLRAEWVELSPLPCPAPRSTI